MIELSSVLVLVPMLVAVERRDMMEYEGEKKEDVGSRGGRFDGWISPVQEPTSPQGFCSWSKQMGFDMRPLFTASAGRQSGDSDDVLCMFFVILNAAIHNRCDVQNAKSP